jgi:hypothetical protein
VLVLLRIFKKKRWLNFEEAVDRYKPFHTVYYGIIDIHPKDIIGLSLPEKQIKNDHKMLKLRELVSNNGWNDPHPSDLHLYHLPNGKFTVCSGGNHRSFLANELMIPKIKAYVTILIPRKSIDDEIKSKMEYYLFKEEEYEKEAIRISDWLNEKEIYRDDYIEEVNLLNDYNNRARKMYDKQKEILLELAHNLKILPKKI